MMLIAIGVITSILSLIDFTLAHIHGYFGNYEKSNHSEVRSALWLIAALICFK